jgi:hypothetical protein
MDVEVPLTEDVKVAEMVLHGALIGEVMMSTLSLERVRQLVSSLSLSTDAWKIVAISPSRFVLFDVGVVDVKKYYFFFFEIVRIAIMIR